MNDATKASEPTLIQMEMGLNLTAILLLIGASIVMGMGNTSAALVIGGVAIVTGFLAVVCAANEAGSKTR